MTKYLLHGGFTLEDNKSNRAFFTEFVKDIPDGGNALLVYFASRTEEEIPQKFEAHKKMCREQSGEKKINFTFATRENFLVEITKASAVFFNGGSTNKLLVALKNYPDLKPLMAGKTVAGSSAGAYIMATLGASHSENVVREGLGLVPLRVICHYGSPKLPPSEDSVKVLSETSTDLRLVTLKDFEWEMFEGE